MILFNFQVKNDAKLIIFNVYDKYLLTFQLPHGLFSPYRYVVYALQGNSIGDDSTYCADSHPLVP